MDRADSATVARLAGVALLFAGWVGVLAARTGEISRDAEGSLLFLIGVAMLGAHVLLRRQVGATPDAALAALFGVVSVPAGLVSVLWTTPDAPSGTFDVVDPDSVGSALLVSAVVFALAWVLGREPRWLFVTPIAAAAGVVLHVTSGGVAGAGGGGDWPRFLVLLAAIAAVVVVARFAGRADQRNLFVAAALLVPAAFVSVPVADGPSALRDAVGVAFIAGMSVLAWRHTSPGVGFAVLALIFLEVVSLAQHGATVVPGLVLLLSGAILVTIATVVHLGARHLNEQSVLEQ